MKRKSLLAVVILSFAVSAFAESEYDHFEGPKKATLVRNAQMIKKFQAAGDADSVQKLQKYRACVEASTDHDLLVACKLEKRTPPKAAAAPVTTAAPEVSK